MTTAAHGAPLSGGKTFESTLNDVLTYVHVEAGQPYGGEALIRRRLRGYRPDTIHLMARGIAAGASGDELYRLLCGLATEVHVREYSEFAPVNGGDPDEMWAFVRALHRYDIPELAGAGDLSEADPRTKSICRALLAVTHAAYDAGAPDSCPNVIHHLSPEEPEWDWEPVIVHEGLLDLIRSHPEHGEWIAGTVRERGFDGIEAARTALGGGSPTVLADGVL